MDFLDRGLWERKWLDLWTVVHFATGMCFGFAVFFYDSPLIPSFVVFFVFMVVWEVLEHFHQAKEPLSNQFTDVVSGGLGFLLTIYTVPLWAPTLSGQLLYFTGVYLIAWLFAYFGFRSFAIHFHKELLKKYEKSYYSAAILYLVIVSAIFVF